jgi:hypothetical protein
MNAQRPYGTFPSLEGMKPSQLLLSVSEYITQCAVNPSDGQARSAELELQL